MYTYTQHTYIALQYSTYSNTRNSLSKLTDDRIRSVWNNGVLIEDQMDTINPEAEERITHHHLYCYFSQDLKNNSTHMSTCYITIPYRIKTCSRKKFFFSFVMYRNYTDVAKYVTDLAFLFLFQYNTFSM